MILKHFFLIFVRRYPHLYLRTTDWIQFLYEILQWKVDIASHSFPVDSQMLIFLMEHLLYLVSRCEHLATSIKCCHVCPAACAAYFISVHLQFMSGWIITTTFGTYFHCKRQVWRNKIWQLVRLLKICVIKIVIDFDSYTMLYGDTLIHPDALLDRELTCSIWNRLFIFQSGRDADGCFWILQYLICASTPVLAYIDTEGFTE